MRAGEVVFAEPQHLHLRRIAPGCVVTLELQVRNGGARAAYVLPRCHDHLGRAMRAERASVSPEGLVVPPHLTKTFRVSLAPTFKDTDELKRLTARAEREGHRRPALVTLSLFCGDEILRRRVRSEIKKISSKI